MNKVCQHQKDENSNFDKIKQLLLELCYSQNILGNSKDANSNKVFFLEAKKIILEREQYNTVIDENTDIEDAERWLKLYFDKYEKEYNCRHQIYFKPVQSSRNGYEKYYWKPNISIEL